MHTYSGHTRAGTTAAACEGRRAAACEARALPCDWCHLDSSLGACLRGKVLHERASGGARGVTCAPCNRACSYMKLTTLPHFVNVFNLSRRRTIGERPAARALRCAYARCRLYSRASASNAQHTCVCAHARCAPPVCVHTLRPSIPSYRLRATTAGIAIPCHTRITRPLRV